ncbi:MAG: hypothetical protein ACRDMV_06455 [Streptosporangiales bacterium]
MIGSYSGRHCWPALLAALTLVVATSVACTSQSDAGHQRSKGHHSARSAGALDSPRPRAGMSLTGCGGTPVVSGNPPSWAFGKQHGFRDGNQVPYATSDHGLVVAYLYGYPLAVTHLGSHRDKVLWFAKQLGSPFQIHGYPVDADHPVFSKTLTEADGMPSHVKVPLPGCWRFTLTWSDSHNETRRDTISLRYVAQR